MKFAHVVKTYLEYSMPLIWTYKIDKSENLQYKSVENLKSLQY